VLLTDLDGTLLDDETYEPGPARIALRALEAAGVLVVPASSKTRAEQEVVRDELQLDGPFVVENGAAIVLPDGDEEVLGRERDEVRDLLHLAAAEAGLVVRGFVELTDEQVADLTGLPPPDAARARQRRYSECFLLEGEGFAGELRGRLEDAGLRLTEGTRFWTVTGDHDKGAATERLIAVLRREQDDRTPPADGLPVPVVYAIGDHHNDAEMLAAADVGMQVRRPDGSWTDLGVEGLVRLDGVGPRGWCEGARRILADLEQAAF
jgi:mannosyl-3-phosphoglycerate phosphatase